MRVIGEILGSLSVFITSVKRGFICGFTTFDVLRVFDS